MSANVVTCRLDINGTSYLANTFDTTTLQVTKRIQSLRFIESAQGTITEQRFRLPLTESLIRALGDITDPRQTAKVDIRKSIDGSILLNGSPVAAGRFLIMSAYLNPTSGAKELELIFKGNETALKGLLNDITLKELLDGETIPYNVDEIYLSFTNAINRDNYIINNGITWQLIDYGQNFVAGTPGTGETQIDDDANPLSQLDFKPSLTIQKVFDLVEEQFDITLTGPNTDLLRQSIPLHWNEERIPVLDTSINDNTGYMFRDNVLTYTNVVAGTFSDVIHRINMNKFFNFNNTGWEVTADQYIANRDGFHSFQFDYDLTMADTATSAVFKKVFIGAEINGGAYFDIDQLFGTFGPQSKGRWNRDLDLSDGDSIVFFLRITTQSADTGYTVETDQQLSTRIACVQAPRVGANSNVVLSENVDPELKVYDIIKTIISQCNGILETKVDGYNIKPWEDWKDEGTETIIIDDILAENKEITTEPTGLTGAKKIRFTYQEGEDIYSKRFREITGQEYGTLFIEDTGSEFAKDTYEIKLPFSNGVPVLIPGTSATTIKMVDEEGEVVKPKMKLLPYVKYSVGQSIELRDYVTGTTYTTDFIFPVNHWVNDVLGGFTTDDNNFGESLTFFSATGYPQNNLYYRYWRNYIRETYGPESRKVTLSVNLRATKFAQLKLNEKFYYQNKLFRCAAIKNFNLVSDTETQLELIKRITLLNSDIAPLYPVDVERSTREVQWNKSSDNSSVGNANGEPPADVRASASAYGFFYDEDNNIAIQQGLILAQ